MAKLIQYCTIASLYDGAFGGAVAWPAAGMGYVIYTDDGAVVIDGGLPEDAAPIVDLIGDRPVRLWIITHPHYDHYGALHAIVSNKALKERVRVDSLCYYFPAELLANDGSHVCEKAEGHISDIATALGTSTHRPSYLENITVGDVDIRFIYVPDDCSIFKGQDDRYIVFSIMVSGMTIYMHRSNIVRLVKGTENKLGSKKSKGEK